MQMTQKIKKAMAIAVRQHEGQLRLDDLTPFVCHPISVAIIVSNYSNDEDLIVAAFLHDTIEDTDYTETEIEKDFGSKIKNLVMELTVIQDEGPGRDWKKQNEEFLANLPKKSRDSLIIKMADNIHNLSDTADCYELYGEEFLAKFNTPIEASLNHEENILSFIKETFGNTAMVEEYEATVANAKKRILG